MADGLRDGDDGVGGFRCFDAVDAALGFTGDDDGILFGCCEFQKLVGGEGYEIMAVLAEGTDKTADLGVY